MKIAKIMIGLIVLCVMMTFSPAVFAAEISWDGGGTDNNWSTPENWAGDTVPGSGDKAVFDSSVSTKDCSIAANVNVEGIEIKSGYSGVITQEAGKTVTVGSGNFAQAGGTFIGGNSKIDINGTCDLSGGTFTSTSGTMSVYKDLIVTGTFAHNSGTVKFDGRGNIVDTGGAELNDVEIKTSSSYGVTAVGTVNVTGDLIIIQTQKINGGIIAVAGDVTTTDTYVEGSTIIKFVGSGDQTLGAAGGEGDLPGIEIAKTGSGVLTIEDTIWLYGSSGLKYTSGDVDTAGSMIKFSGRSTTTVDSGSMIFDDVTLAKTSSMGINVVNTMDVDGDLCLEEGAFVGVGTIVVSGNVLVTDDLLRRRDDGTLEFDGDNVQTLELRADASALDMDIRVKKTGGRVKLLSDLSVDAGDPGPSYTVQVLTVEEGMLDINGNTLTVNHMNSIMHMQGTKVEGGGALVLADGGALTGHGTVGESTPLDSVDNSGQVIADGDGSEKVLDLNYTAFSNTTDNPTTNGKNGWFAENTGVLSLPGIPVAGSGPYYWGEDDGPDLVNSISLLFDGVTAGGLLDISLLALDRPDIPDLEGGTIIGAWAFESAEGLAFSSVDLVFRYDDALADFLGLVEDDLRLYHYWDDKWNFTDDSVDPANKWVTGDNITSFSPFVIGTQIFIPIPEPSSLIMFALAMAGGWFGAGYNKKRE